MIKIRARECVKDELDRLNKLLGLYRALSPLVRAHLDGGTEWDDIYEEINQMEEAQ